MRIERMTEKAFELAPTPILREVGEVEFQRFVTEGVGVVTTDMAKWIVGPALNVDRDLLVKETAKALSQVPIDDPNLRFTREELAKPSVETISLAVPLALAKAQAVEREFHLTPKEKRAVTSFKTKARKAALGLATFSLVASACTSEAKPTVSPTPFNTESVATESSPTETPTTAPAPEILATAAEPATPTLESLSPETISELAEKLDCGETGCIYEMFPPPDQPDIIVNAGVEVLATGRIKRVQLFDPESGNIIGTADTVLVLTRNAENKPLVLEIAVQMMSIDEPNVNLLAILTNYMAGNNIDVFNNTPYSIEDLEKIFPIGRHLSVGFSTDSFYTDIPDSEIVSSLYKDANYISLLEAFVSNKDLNIDADSLFIIPTSFTAEDIEDLIRNNTEFLTFQNQYEGHVALSVPGIPENIANSMSTENMRLDSTVLDALNKQGYSPVVSSATDSLGLLLIVGDKKAALINAPERLINYGGVAGRLGSEQGTVSYGRYGEPPLVRLLTLIPFEQDGGIYSAGAFVTSNVSGQEIGSFVIIFFDANTGKVIQALPAEFPEKRNLRVEWQEKSPVVYIDGQKQEY